MEETGVAALVAAMRADLEARIATAPDDVRVRSVEPVTWRDGSLGCPEPGRFYTQALVPGYRVLLEAGGVPYAYHASRRGRFKLCTNPELDRSGTVHGAS